VVAGRDEYVEVLQDLSADVIQRSEIGGNRFRGNRLGRVLSTKLVVIHFERHLVGV